jgi:nitrite reductase (NADH) small subunit
MHVAGGGAQTVLGLVKRRRPLGHAVPPGWRSPREGRISHAVDDDLTSPAATRISDWEAVGNERPARGGVMAGARRVKVASIGEVSEGQARVVEAEGRSLALFNVGGSYYALDNECAHRGGPLGEGDLEGRLVVCPWHAWRWDVTTGRNANNPAVTMACYSVRVEADGVFVELAG